jgi:eukaryotic-like serine/threonine-protein kinase
MLLTGTTEVNRIDGDIADTLSASDAPRSNFKLSEGLTLDGRYRLLHIIGRGGMGEVWSAQHQLLERSVAIKFVAIEQPEAAQMLLKEARVLASLRDPAIVEVFDCGIFADAPYLVMEELEGETLASKLDREGPRPLREAVELLLPVIRGLETVHAHGIVHRDIKPDNIVLCRTAQGPRPKLIDFGIAGAAAKGSATLAPMGTPPYMSPEQIADVDVGPNSDVWAIGITLYELVTGVLPFVSSNSLPSILEAIATAPLSYPRAGQALDKSLWRLLTDCTRKYPMDRPSMHAVAASLESWLDSPKVMMTLPPASSESTPPLTLQPSAAGPPSLDELIRKRFQ